MADRLPIRETGRGPQMTQADAELRLGRQLAIEIFIVLAIGFVLGLIGPFGSYAMPLVWRLDYWMGFGLMGYVLFRPLNAVAELAARISGVPSWIAVGLAGLVAGFPMTLMIGFVIGGMQWDNPYLDDGFALLYAQVCGMGLAVYGISYWLFIREFAPGAEPIVEHAADIAALPAPSVAGVVLCPLHAQLPPAFPPILALSVEDHYVKVHAAGRSAMLLMPLTEAIGAMGAAEGVKVHRSWWVASSAVTGAKRIGRDWQLTLANGITAPVSRQNVAAARAAGLLV